MNLGVYRAYQTETSGELKPRTLPPYEIVNIRRGNSQLLYGTKRETEKAATAYDR